MKPDRVATATATIATLQGVLDRLAAETSLAASRRRDLRSAVTSFAKLKGQPPGAIGLDLAAIRETLDRMVPAAAKMSAKRWANLRSDLAAAIDASGLHPMLKTADLGLDATWTKLVKPVTDPRVRNGLSRFARWASLRGVAPDAVGETVIARFAAELEAGTLIRNLDQQGGTVTKTWNILVTLQPDCGLRPVQVAAAKPPIRVALERLPLSFQTDLERYLTWASAPDPLADDARARALAPKTLRLRREQIHSAVSAAVAAGIPVAQLISLASLVAPDVFRVILRHRWQQDGSKLSAYTHGLAGGLIAIALEWVKAPPDVVSKLKADRRKLGTLPPGLTDKNKAMLRKFDDPHRLRAMIDLPDRLWCAARRDLARSRRPFIDLQSALALDLLLHVPLRMENLARLSFQKHLHWPQGPGKPALVVIGADETKNDGVLEFEVPTVLADRLRIYRDDIAPKVTGIRPGAVFIGWTGQPRTQGAITVAINKTVLKHLGMKLTPHQFRHIAAKIILDASPGAYELVRQLLGHKNMKTTTNFYAGIDTRRAGRAHADLIMALRDPKPVRPYPRRSPGRRKD
jgi:integrase